MVLGSRQQISLPKYFVCGGVGGLCAVLCGHPLDTVKVRLQSVSVPTTGCLPLYDGVWDCFRKTVHTEGVRGLYKGMLAPLLGAVPVFSLSFLSFGMAQGLVTANNTKPLTKPQIFACGAFAGFTTVPILTPGERIKCLLQTQLDCKEKTPKYKGFIDCARKVYAEGGFRNLYRGSIATLAREIPATGVYFLTYESIRDALISKGTNNYIKSLVTVFAGGLAGMGNWLVGMPADVLKTRLQTAPIESYPNGIRDAFKELMAKEGPRGLYRGFTPALIRAFPANGACFLGFECSARFGNWLVP